VLFFDESDFALRAGPAAVGSGLDRVHGQGAFPKAVQVAAAHRTQRGLARVVDIGRDERRVQKDARVSSETQRKTTPAGRAPAGVFSAPRQYPGRAVKNRTRCRDIDVWRFSQPAARRANHGRPLDKSGAEGPLKTY